MLSAESEGVVYYSGRIPDPKSRSYTCRVCEKVLSHVSATTRTFRQTSVVEYFRHQKGEIVNHPEVDFSWQSAEITQNLIQAYAQLPDTFEFETDKVYSGHTYRHEGLEFAVNFTARFKKTQREVAFFIHGGSFGGKEMIKKLEILAQQDVVSMMILSAQGERNENGKFYRLLDDPNRPDNLRKIPGNEKSIYERFGHEFLLYFDHDDAEFFQVVFSPYFEVNDYTGNNEEKKTFKIPRIVRRGRFLLPSWSDQVYGRLLMSRPWLAGQTKFSLFKDIMRLKKMKKEEKPTAAIEAKLKDRIAEFEDDKLIVNTFKKITGSS